MVINRKIEEVRFSMKLMAIVNVDPLSAMDNLDMAVATYLIISSPRVIVNSRFMTKNMRIPTISSVFENNNTKDAMKNNANNMYRIVGKHNAVDMVF
jgi:hypothetical protein